jgi:AAA+ ATPase superfamily predicted ATPase
MRMDPLLLSQARSFLRRLGPVELIEAYAASGGYPLHLAAWDQDLTTQENLLRLAFSPGGLLLEDARGMIGEELSDMGGYPRILAAIGRGRTRASEIANDAQQRIEYPLDVLVRSGLVRRSVPVGAPRRARPLYEVADAYLSFWFRVLYPETGLIEAGQGRAVSRRRRPQWRQQLGWVFEEAARAHASRLVEQGDLPDDLVVGRWWSTSGEPCEVDVLGLRGGATALLGESRWQERPLGIRELTALTMKLSWVPGPADDPLFALWGRGGVESGLRRRGVMGFAAADVIA